MPFSASASSAGISLDHDPMFPACPDEISALPKTSAKSFIKRPERGQEVIAREGGWDHRSHPQPSGGQRGRAGRPGWGRDWHAECRKSRDTAKQQAALPGTGTEGQGAVVRVSCEPGGEDDGDRGPGRAEDVRARWEAQPGQGHTQSSHVPTCREPPGLTLTSGSRHLLHRP